MSAYERYLSDLAAIEGLDATDAAARERIERDHREAGIRAQRAKDETVELAGKLNGRAIDLGVRARRLAQREGITGPDAPAKDTEVTAAVLDDLERTLARVERNRDWLDRQAAVVPTPVQAAPTPVIDAPAPVPPAAGRKGCAALVLGATLLVPVVVAIGSVVR